MKVFDDDGTELVKCEMCENGVWWSECCNGAEGCSCQGQPVNMGTCNVCGGKGFRKPNANKNANSDYIRRNRMLFAGSGPVRGYWSKY